MKTKTFVQAAVGYLVVTFALGFLWHLVLFEETYRSLGIYSRLDDPIFALGILAMVIQGVILAAVFPRFFEGRRPIVEGLRFSLTAGLFFASGTVIAEVAKQQVSSLPLWFLVAGGFALVHFTAIGVLFGWIFGREVDGSTIGTKKGQIT